MTAPLGDILSAKAEMETLEIQPNSFFAYFNLRGVDAIADALRDKPANRLEAAQAALGDFEATGVELTGLCKKVKRALQMLNP